MISAPLTDEQGTAFLISALFKERAPEDLDLPQEAVYFIQAGMYVKIGRATRGRIHERLGELQIGNPFTLKIIASAVVHDATEAEAQLHRQWAHLRRRGEWFLLTPELYRFIDENTPNVGRRHLL